jgi:hypothetical protein
MGLAIHDDEIVAPLLVELPRDHAADHAGPTGYNNHGFQRFKVKPLV